VNVTAKRHAIACFLVTCALLVSCGEPRRTIPPTYTVREGDTLYAIAWRHNLDYRVLARWNNLPPDYTIYPGQVLTLRPRPGESYREPRPAPPSPQREARTAPVQRQLTPEERVAAWVWPADGESHIVRHVATESQGLLISGTEGAPVRAAAAGKVVYTGSGLRGFGNLVIIRHTSVFLSAYGHNRSVSVREGDAVNPGQVIAEMGLGPGRKPALYFEIRLDGSPVDPLAYLPGRR
jgi:lipoprotein NlpD